MNRTVTVIRHGGYYYGEAEPYRRGRTRMRVLMGPAFSSEFGLHGYGAARLLTVDVAVPIYGHMLMETRRIIQMPEDWEERGLRVPFGPPQRVIHIAYDPGPNEGAWRGEMEGSWPCMLKKPRSPTLWQCLRLASV